MTGQSVDVDPAGENIAGETPAGESEAVTDDTTVHGDDIELMAVMGSIAVVIIVT